MVFVRILLAALALSFSVPSLFGGFPIGAPPMKTATHGRAAGLASDGRGFLALIARGFRESGVDLVAIGPDGRTGAPVTLALSGSGTLVRLDDHYLVSLGDATRVRSYELSSDGSIIRPWPIERAGLWAEASTSDGKRIFLRDITGRSHAIATAEGNIVRELGPAPGRSIVGSDASTFFLQRLFQAPLTIDRISAYGDVPDQQIDLPRELATSGQLPVSAISAGRDTLIAWSTAANSYVNLALVTREGGMTRSTITIPGIALIRSLAFYRDEAGIVLIAAGAASETAEAVIATARFDDAGQRAAEPRILGPAGRTFGFSLASFNGSRVLLSLAAGWPTGYESIAASFLLGADPDLRIEPLSKSPAAQSFPSAASDGTGYMAVWRESTASRQSIVAGGFSRNGDAIGEPVVLQDAQGFVAGSDIAFGGGLYLVTWRYWNSTFAARITPDGEVLDSRPIALHASQIVSDPVVASNGTSFVIAWIEDRKIYTVIVSASGSASAPVEMGIGVPDNHWLYEVALASDGKRFMLVWTVARPNLGNMVGSPSASVHSMLLDAGGAPLRATESRLGEYGLSPRIASSGRDFLVAFSGPPTVDGVFVSADTGAPGPRVSLGAPGYAYDFRGLIWDGSRYVSTRSVLGGIEITTVERDGSTSARLLPAQVTSAFGQDAASNGAGETFVLTVEHAGAPRPSFRVIARSIDEIPATTRRRSARR